MAVAAATFACAHPNKGLEKVNGSVATKNADTGSPDTATQGAPVFSVKTSEGKTTEVAEACFNGSMPWSVVASGVPTTPCFRGPMEDGCCKLMFDMGRMADGEQTPFPKPGDILPTAFEFHDGATSITWEAKVQVIRHERPFVIVEIGAAPGASSVPELQAFGGQLKVRMPEDLDSLAAWADENVVKASGSGEE